MEIKEIKIYKISKTLAIMKPTGVESVTYNFEKQASCIEEAAVILAADLEIIVKELRMIKPPKKTNAT